MQSVYEPPLLKLANKLWGSTPGDRYILAIPRPGKVGRDYAFKTTDEALEFAQKKNAENNDVWFSQALFMPDTSRAQINALSAKSFWLDLDVEPGNAKKYETELDAMSALAKFAIEVGLPVPTLVHSGVGIQAHWILTQRIDREQWEELARALKNAAKRRGLKQDPTRTADIASVMRLPGTFHRKKVKEPKPVSVGGEIMPEIAVEVFKRCMSSYIVVTNARIANKVFDVSMPRRPNDANKVANGCGVVAAMRDTKGCVPEPIWMHVLQLLHHCTDGAKIAHEWSNGHPEYSEDACQAKFDAKVDMGPTNCATFEDKWQGEAPCLTCPHHGRITSPIQLGATMTPAFELVAQEPTAPKSLVRAETNDLEYVPHGYTVGREGVWFHDDEAEKDKPIVKNTAMALVNKDKSLDGGGTIATFKIQRPTGSIEYADIPVRDLADVKTVTQWMFDNDITGFHARNSEAVRDFMQASIHLYSQKQDPGYFHERLGWTPEEHPQQGFVLGERLITVNGVIPAKLNSKRVPPSIIKGFSEKGTLDGWANATEFIKDERYMPHQFTLLMMFASPLFQLLGFQGSVISLVGKTGLGKTTSAYMGMSAFGVYIGTKKATKALEIGAGSSDKSFRERWMLAHNLPVLIDEAHTIKNHKVSIEQLMYDAANGTMRDVLRRNSTIRPSDNFNLITVLGCNTPMLNHPISILSDAARKRVFEFNLGKEHEIEKSDAVACYAILEKNYGVAGRVYLEEVLKLKEYIESQETAIKQSYANSPLPSDYRFKQWNVGAGRLAGDICEKLNIIRFDYRKPIAWALKAIERESMNEVAPVEIIGAVLSEYERLHQSKFSVIRNGDSWYGNQVFGECAGRYHKDRADQWTLAVPKTVFQEFVRESGADEHALKEWVKAKKVETKNVKLTGIMGTAWCYVIPITGDNVPVE